MEIKKSKFIKSLVNLNDKPDLKLPEIACVGRSNVGKSTLINSITNRKKLAQVSKSPGKTKLINYFLINEIFYLVDLPGYGFAKVSQRERKFWQKMIETYITRSKELKLILVLTDLRIGPQESDLQIIEWLNYIKKPYKVVGTKADKLNKTILKSNINKYYHQNKFIGSDFLAYSSVTKLGKDILLNILEQAVGKF